jgi:hypothetical protein
MLYPYHKAIVRLVGDGGCGLGAVERSLIDPGFVTDELPSVLKSDILEVLETIGMPRGSDRHEA